MDQHNERSVSRAADDIVQPEAIYLDIEMSELRLEVWREGRCAAPM
jgi:hypothetical protein